MEGRPLLPSLEIGCTAVEKNTSWLMAFRS